MEHCAPRGRDGGAATPRRAGCDLQAAWTAARPAHYGGRPLWRRRLARRTGRVRRRRGAKEDLSLLHPTPEDLRVDLEGRPYFPWDMDMTLEVFRRKLPDPSPEVRVYFVAKPTRQAMPDDVCSFVTLGEIKELGTRIQPRLGMKRDF